MSLHGFPHPGVDNLPISADQRFRRYLFFAVEHQAPVYIGEMIKQCADIFSQQLAGMKRQGCR